ncbi:hypothetical protein GO755_29835 [Spirosoma sp. HMF4905]|uniref:HTH cro/C1-type domain-containing protein n=1 Tax=Spirosoma arboris TaxID=2682092 RepID=A0A7K1SKD3_9BACT|nr:LexA family transcriptional regulator [Spirosoma arboris]MVM34269.1 hypothetical protein [Spirosoma arboris]
MKTPDPYTKLMARIPRPDDQDGIRKRIKDLIFERFNDRQGELAQKAELQPAAISNILSGKAQASVKQLRAIETASRARFEWLATGEEPMLHPMDWRPLQIEPTKEGDHLRNFIERHKAVFSQKQLADELDIAKGSITDYFTSASLKAQTRLAIMKALRKLLDDQDLTEDEVFGSGESETEWTQPIRHIGNFSAEPIIHLPFVPVGARAGIPTPKFWEQPMETVRIMRAILADYEPDPRRPQKDWWLIEVDGDSMEPQIRSRARALGYYVGNRISKTVWEVDLEKLYRLKPGVWAIQYDDDFVIKRVMENTLFRDKQVVLHSDSPPPGPFTINIDSIRHVWFIESTVNNPVR